MTICYSNALPKLEFSNASKGAFMIQKYLVSFCIFLYAIAVPFLEINATHVFNPDWTPHVRIHEVWQLITNSSLGLLCLWLVWFKKQVTLGSLISLLVVVGFLIAFIMQDLYGGSMKYLDGSEKTLFGINIGVVGFGLAFSLLLLSIYLEKMKKKVGS